jgi:hypothetical protein
VSSDYLTTCQAAFRIRDVPENFVRVAAGDYETKDGRFRMWRIPDVYPPAWNVEDTRTCFLIVDGAATMHDALAIAAVRMDVRK